jgi:hypothetical protein
MEIKTRWINSIFISVSIHHDNVVIDMGILDEKERLVLASHLKEVVDELERD